MHRVSLTGAHPVDPERAPATVVQQVVSQHGGAQLAYYLAILRPHDGEARSLESQTDPGNEPTPLRLLIAANARATLDQDGAEGLLARAIELEPAAANWAVYRIAAATIAANRGDEEAVRRLLDTLDKGFVAQFLALAAWNADSGTLEGRRRQLEYLDSGIAAARPDVQLDRLLLVSAHAQRGAVQAQAGDVVAAKEAVARRSRVPRSMKPCTSFGAMCRRHCRRTGYLPTQVVDRLAQERIRPGG